MVRFSCSTSATGSTGILEACMACIACIALRNQRLKCSGMTPHAIHACMPCTRILIETGPYRILNDVCHAFKAASSSSPLLLFTCRKLSRGPSSALHSHWTPRPCACLAPRLVSHTSASRPCCRHHRRCRGTNRRRCWHHCPAGRCPVHHHRIEWAGGLSPCAPST